MSVHPSILHLSIHLSIHPCILLVCTFLPNYVNMHIMNKTLVSVKLNFPSGYANDRVLPSPSLASSPLPPYSHRLRAPKPRTSKALLIPPQPPGSWLTLFHRKAGTDRSWCLSSLVVLFFSSLQYELNAAFCCGDICANSSPRCPASSGSEKNSSSWTSWS